MLYIYADITITPFCETTADVLTAMLGEVGYDAFEQTDYGLKAYINKDDFSEEDLRGTLDNIFIPDVKFSYTINELENKDWNQQWEQTSFDPVLEREFGIRLNPRMAFGSGSHETTHQITSILCHSDFTSQRVLDMGTGTGVLAIAMAMHGASDVVAIDIDEFSVENAKENFALNNIMVKDSPYNTLCSNNASTPHNINNVEVIHGDASAISGDFDTIVANIHKNILKADMETYVKHLSANGTLIISGFFSEDAQEMIEAANHYSLKLTNLKEENSWTVLTFKKQ